MSAYNRVLGEWCGHNAPLLRTILKKEWGFDGFVMSDFIWGIRDAVAAANGGLDIEMPVTQYFGGLLEEAVACGAVDPTVIEESARRIIRQKLRFSKVGEPMRYSPESVCCLAHIELSREAAVKSSVLLKNDGILPLAKTRVRTIAVIGALANTPNTGDMKGSSAVFSPYTVTPLEGIRSLCGDDVEILYADGTIPHEVYNKCQKSDAVIIFAGLTCREEGEYILKEGAVGGDRVDLSLPEWQKDYIQTAKEANPRCIVCIEGGSAVLTEAWEAGVAAILYCWYPGMEGGNAIAQLLFGKANPSGKLPFTIPKSPQQLPYFDRDAEEIEYGYYHGYFLADREKHDVSYPFGFGLSYTRFSVFGIRVNADKTRFTAEAMVKNIGTVAGGEVVQLYIAYEGSAVERHKKDLKDFCKVYLEPNEEKTVKLTVEKKALAYYDEIRHEWAQEDIQYFALIGTSSRERDLTRLPFRFLV
ncbi:Thermostable beta-glucosidase B [bioreactor metagenome]|uniref:Thermostable beta-glucosidase B n=1 Tax=bioreactor metagenome TaxID=1076179 RepID=A0A644Y887_9ZZZZ